ncbi:uncharacterized protein J4E87_000118 [Alternaria ethzedia]|uniref:uncharacterized protein n=1 Tax=Alternaria ethzedia TaxID=181014 RepID=UPI0020C27E91|nr:uncharacterized protein J4E87_000118 [Alternaria ethzedia]KAI4635168.1 hypothetical protein J4E87_000118 [Alternaria ethzedia]
MSSTDMVKTSVRDKYVVLKEAPQGFHGGKQNVGVYVVKYRPLNETCVEKRVTAYQNGVHSIHSEIATMEQCRKHPNIVSIMGSDTADLDHTYGSIWMQHCELGSLDALIMRYKERQMRLPDEGFFWKVFWDISQALCYLWTGQDCKKTRDYAMQGRPVEGRVRGWNAIRHRDLKPANILLTWSSTLAGDTMNSYPTVVLCDFGCSVKSTDISLKNQAAKLLDWVDVAFEPPESTYSERGDIYALGLILLCLGQMRQRPNMDVLDPECDPLGYSNYFQLELGSLVGECLEPDPSDRPKQEILPVVVWEGYQEWRSYSGGDGKPLPKWAFE